jgi:phospholipid-binding lipoprotein MlaA
MFMNRVYVAFAGVWLLAGCSTDDGTAQNDPYQSTNRSFYASHQVLYKNVIRPVADFYNNTAPEPARDGIHNFLVNMDLPVTFANDLLQAEFLRGGETLARFTVNTTVGVAGFVDVAEKIGIPVHETDFADTLADYGVGEGPYLYLPVIGPMVPRELAGKVVDSAFDPLTYVTYGGSIFVDLGHTGTAYLDKRARGVAVADEIENTSLDPYETTHILYEKHLEAGADHAALDADYDDHPDDVKMAVAETRTRMASAGSSAGADPPPDASTYCASVADARAEDAAANGYEDEDRQAVRDGTYKECTSWQTAHAGQMGAVTRLSMLHPPAAEDQSAPSDRGQPETRE